MGTWLKALAAAIGLPLLAFAVIATSLATLDRYVYVGSANDVGLGTTLETLALVSVATSVAMLVGIIPITIVGRRSRPFLGLVFRPVLLLILGALLVVMVIDGALVMGSVYLAESAFFGVIQPWLLGVLGIAVLTASSGVVGAIRTMLTGTPVMVRGARLGREADHELIELVADVARVVGTEPPEQIIAGLDPTFFVVDADVVAFGRPFTGRTLFVSLPLCRILSVDELRAVIAHELGHFKGEDTQYSRRFAPGFHGAVTSLAMLRASSRGVSGLPLMAPRLVLEACFERFGAAERELRRSRELAADAVAADATCPDAIAGALLKLAAYSSAWDEVFKATVLAIQQGQPVGNFSERYAKRARAGADIAAILWREADAIPHPFDTHPPVAARLSALGVSADALAAHAAVVDPSNPAIRLIGGAEDLEVELTDRLAAGVGTMIGRPVSNTATDHASALRAAATADPLLARLITLFEPFRGPDLERPLDADGPWMALADLEVAPHPDPRPFLSRFPDDVIPGGEQRLVIGLAGAGVPDDRKIDAGTMLWLAGIGAQERRRAGQEEIYFIDGGNGFPATQVVVVRELGEAPLAHQVAGLFVAPAKGPLAYGLGRVGEELNALIRELSSRGDDTSQSGLRPPLGTD